MKLNGFGIKMENKLKNVKENGSKRKHKGDIGKKQKTKSRKSRQINRARKERKEIMKPTKSKKKKKEKEEISKKLHSLSLDHTKRKYEKSVSLKNRLSFDENASKKKMKKTLLRRKTEESVIEKKLEIVKEQENNIKHKDIIHCKNKVKHSIFKRHKGHKKSFENEQDDDHNDNDNDKKKRKGIKKSFKSKSERHLRSKSRLIKSKNDKILSPKNQKQRPHSKSFNIPSHSYDAPLYDDNGDIGVHCWSPNDDNNNGNAEHSVTVTTTFKRIEEQLETGMIEPGSSQYQQELDDAMKKL